MKILLIDADSKIPNLALMKLSTFYKSKGAEVSLKKLDLPYYPSQIKRHQIINTEPFDRAFCSVVFEGNKQFVHGENIIFGGTGVDLTTNLPDPIENLKPDYSLYPENDVAYGFISRGCIRNCSFCKVPRKEGGIRQVDTVERIATHGGFSKVKFLDNNFLALPNHQELLQEIIDRGIRCQFNQGLDIRLITKENSDLLAKVKHLGEVIFAFDSKAIEPIVAKKLDLLAWRKPWQLKFFVYCHPEMPIQSDVVWRVNWLKEHQCLPYFMRNLECWKSEKAHFYTDYSAYCNQPAFFKKMTFENYMREAMKDRTTKQRIERVLGFYQNS